MLFKKREEIKKYENKKYLSCVVKILCTIVIIGFTVAITVLVHERIQFSKALISATVHKNSAKFLDNLAHLLEAYNKSVTIEFLSLLYTIIATIAFTYGLTIISKFHEDIQETKKDLAEIRDKENSIRNLNFFSRLESRLNVGFFIAVELRAHHSGNCSVWLTILVENLHDCEEHFPVWEIKRRGEIDAFSQKGLRDILGMIQDVLTSIPQDVNFDGSNLIKGSAVANDHKAIEEIFNICERYLNALRFLKINDQFPE